MHFIVYDGYIAFEQPENCLMGLGGAAREQLFLIDFGLARRCVNMKTGQHIPMQTGKNLTGTARYASLNTHRGYEQSRRDDLESAAYLLIYLLKGELPWQHIRAETKYEKYQQIGYTRHAVLKVLTFLCVNSHMKETLSIERLCKGLPTHVAQFLRYCRQLKFEEKPSYHYLTELLGNISKLEHFKVDNEYDWMTTFQANPKSSNPHHPLLHSKRQKKK